MLSSQVGAELNWINHTARPWLTEAELLLAKSGDAAMRSSFVNEGGRLEINDPCQRKENQNKNEQEEKSFHWKK